TFVRLRSLASALDDVLNAGEVEHADQAVSLASLVQLCSQLFDTYPNIRARSGNGDSTPLSRSKPGGPRVLRTLVS
ncbi:MAG: hypothetical protein QOG58_1281, partial [Caballeronia sp.]|nr:hypothetical protein [Caballeronia sp.]